MKELVLLLLWNVVNTVSEEIHPFANNVTVTVNSDTMLVCETSDIDFSSQFISWNRGESLITFKNELVNNAEGRYTLDIDSANQYTLRIENAMMIDQAKWTCQIQGGHPASEDMWVTVTPTLSVQTLPQSSAQNGTSQTALYCSYTTVPDSITSNSDISPSPIIAIDWKRGSSLLARKTITGDTGDSTTSPNPEKYTIVNEASLSINNVDLEDDDTYTCLVALTIPGWSSVTKSATTRLSVMPVTTPKTVTQRIVTNAQGERITPTTQPRAGVVVDDNGGAIQQEATRFGVVCLSLIAIFLSTSY
ncbi:uncharacterized protein LOC144440098 [Glandiceps talaboti]